MLSYVLATSHLVLALALILSWVASLTSGARSEGWPGWHRSRQAVAMLIGSTGPSGHRPTRAARGMFDEDVTS